VFRKNTPNPVDVRAASRVRTPQRSPNGDVVPLDVRRILLALLESQGFMNPAIKHRRRRLELEGLRLTMSRPETVPRLNGDFLLERGTAHICSGSGARVSRMSRHDVVGRYRSLPLKRTQRCRPRETLSHRVHYGRKLGNAWMLPARRPQPESARPIVDSLKIPSIPVAMMSTGSCCRGTIKDRRRRILLARSRSRPSFYRRRFPSSLISALRADQIGSVFAVMSGVVWQRNAIHLPSVSRRVVSRTLPWVISSPRHPRRGRPNAL
jgi:hypothetical protein